MRTILLILLGMIAHRMGAFSVFEWVTIGICGIIAIIGDLIAFDNRLKQTDTNPPKRFKNPFKTSKNG